MKRLFKSIVIAAAVSALALSVVGCGKKEEKPAEAANATATAPAGPKTIVFASDATYPPMQYTDENKNIVGFEVDVIKAAAEKAGFKAEFKNVAWDGIFAGLATGKYDAISSSVSITEERKATMQISGLSPSRLYGLLSKYGRSLGGTRGQRNSRAEAPGEGGTPEAEEQ